MGLLRTEKLVADHIVHHTCALLFANTAVHRDGPSLPDLQRGTNGTEKHQELVNRGPKLQLPEEIAHLCIAAE